MISFIKLLYTLPITNIKQTSASKILILSPKFDDMNTSSESVLGSQFYNLKTSEISILPTINELINFAIRKESFEFETNNRHYVILPLREAYFIKNGKKVWLGKFQRISITKSSLKMVFSDGDECISGLKYQCIVDISAGFKNYYKQELSELPHKIYLNIKLKDALVTIQKDLISIDSPKPTLGTKLIGLIKNSRKKEECNKKIVNIKRISPKRTSFLIKNRILESAHTINGERLKKMAMMFSKELTDENENSFSNSNRNNVDKEKNTVSNDELNQISNNNSCNTMISKNKKIIEDRNGKNISDISKVFENTGNDSKTKKKKKNTSEAL